MKKIKRFITQYSPYWLQDLIVSIYNTKLYRQRHSGTYKKWRKYYELADSMTQVELKAESRNRIDEFLDFVKTNSEWYRSINETELSKFPILEKKDILTNLKNISTLSEKNAIVSMTGGTTGASMKVLYHPEDMQERFALLDHFRSLHGYKLGLKTAWFSGKELIATKDISKGRVYRDDFINKIRFFSTFHINKNNFSYYWDSLEKFKPRFIVGFPSSIYEIALIAHQNGLKASYKVDAIFPTAETVLPIHRKVIGNVFHTELIDQYASSEGAPFILECKKGNLHIHPLSGVFEVLDSSGNHAQEGEALVTSFSTRGTPLVRYRIGDRIRLADKGELCACGSFFPLVSWIEGRSTDFIFSIENGRVNLGNISNSTKDIKGIHCFQIIQHELDSILVKIVCGQEFDQVEERGFISSLRERVGTQMKIKLLRVDDIPREKSGKFRIVKNEVPLEVINQLLGSCNSNENKSINRS